MAESTDPGSNSGKSTLPSFLDLYLCEGARIRANGHLAALFNAFIMIVVSEIGVSHPWYISWRY